MPTHAGPNLDVSQLVPFHLTARPWYSLEISRNDYLSVLEGLCRFTAHHQDESGAIIDPFLTRELQYATPYFAFAVGTLLHYGMAEDLVERAVRAMEHATLRFAGEEGGVPDNHGEFFLASLPGAFELLSKYVSKRRADLWTTRLATARDRIVLGPINNWRTYAMRGEWARANLGLVDKAGAVDFIEDGWHRCGQRDRIHGDSCNLYQDRETDPESHAVEAVGRGNLLALVEAGYDGPSRAEMEECVQRGTEFSLLLQDPSGQCPPNGRADNHVFNDVLYLLSMEVMSQHAHRVGDDQLAGSMRRAALLGFAGILRWRRQDQPWSGSFYITKNKFAPEMRVGYQAASNYSNYNGAVAFHLAEACLTRQASIEELPAPVEIGGYAVATDEHFSSAVANAGGMQLFAALRGDTETVYSHYWTALGVERFGRTGWDSRLGPSDGVRDAATGRGVSFAPTWVESGVWLRMADVPDRYHGHFEVQFVHPLLVRCSIDYKPTDGAGPSFHHAFVVTPDGVLATLTCSADINFGVTWPLLENDGRPLKTEILGDIASTRSSEDGDQQTFLSLQEGQIVTAEEAPLLSSYGWLRPVRATAFEGRNQTFVYPRNANEPEAVEVLESFKFLPNGFSSLLGIVDGTLYAGRTSAGGEGREVVLRDEAATKIELDEVCRFVAQLRRGRVRAIESDQRALATIDGRSITLQSHVPVYLGSS